MSDVEARRAFFNRAEAAVGDDDREQFADFRRICEAIPEGEGDDDPLARARTQAICLAVTLSDAADNLDLALGAALHIFAAHRDLRRIAEKQHGAP